MSVKIPNKDQIPQITGQTPSNTRKQAPLPQRIQLSSTTRQQVIPLNANGKNVTFTKKTGNQMTDAVGTMATNIAALRKENAELKAKLQQRSQR